MEKYSFHRVNLGQNKEEHYEEERKKRSRSGYDAGSHHDFRANSFRNIVDNNTQAQSKEVRLETSEEIQLPDEGCHLRVKRMAYLFTGRHSMQTGKIKTEVL